MMGLSDGRKSSDRFSRFDTIPASYPSSHPRCQSKNAAYYVAQVKTIFNMTSVRHLEFAKIAVLVT